jgi:anti-sigma regulatory factor (Ser/Thr protein kinase)
MEAKTHTFKVTGGARAAGVARRSVLSVEADLPAPIRHRLALLLSELITDTVKHGGGRFGHSMVVRIVEVRDRVRVELVDRGGTGPPAHTTLEEGGEYGLLLLDRLADAWGREAAADGGSLAWFELDLVGLAVG